MSVSQVLCCGVSPLLQALLPSPALLLGNLLLECLPELLLPLQWAPHCQGGLLALGCLLLALVRSQVTSLSLARLVSDAQGCPRLPLCLSAWCSSQKNCLPPQSCSMWWAPSTPWPPRWPTLSFCFLFQRFHVKPCAHRQPCIDQHVSVTTEKKHDSCVCVLYLAVASLSCVV